MNHDTGGGDDVEQAARERWPELMAARDEDDESHRPTLDRK